MDVCGGRTFKIDSYANINFETIFVEAGARFEVSYGANVTVNTLVVKESLKLYGRTTTSVRLATGMRIGTLMYELDRNSGSGNLLLYSLLGEGKALQYDNSGEYVDIYEKFTSKIIHDSFTVVDHYEHSYDKATGKCVCGYVCPHSDVDSKTGVCSICEYQLTAGISGVGTAKYFDNIDNAFTAALSAENNGCTLTLYKHCEITQNVEIGNTTVTVDVNGCSLGGEADISVNNGGVLYLKDSRKSTYYGCIDAPFSVNGGTLINGTADGGSSAADVLNLVINSAKCVEIYGGIFENVYIAHASGVALYGGRYNTICGEESNTPVNALLAKGYAFATLNSVTHLPESIVDGSAKTIGEGIRNVTVVAHEHRYNVETGKCPCGVCALAIFTETTQSSETYTFIESETQFKNIAENEADGVLKLTGDVDCIVKGIIINGNKTIDMNGHTLNVSVGTEEISAVAVYGNVTFENSGSSRAVINATGVYSYGMVTVNGDIEFDTFATFEDGDALINAGVFKSIYVQGRSVIEILGSGKALASESGEILNASVQQIYKAGDNIFVTAHPKHTYDDHGNCACGYKCLHDGEGQVDEDSANKVCSECGAKIYAKVTTADGKVKYFDDITEGLRYADKAENKGCVFTLVTTGGLENDITLSSGQFTITAIDDNYINAYTRKINIKGAEITVENCAFNCFVGLYSGSLTYPEGSTSVCINGISVFGGTLNISDGVSENFGANKFTISDTATDAKVTIGGGIYGEIKLGQYTFKDILASGTRLISVEYSQETDEIIATNELLYSIVSEQNTLGVDDDKDYRFVKCDHKNEDGSYAFNEGGICKYCNSEFAASVSYTADGGEKTELFSDICDAFDKANEIGTATITLYKNIENNEFTREITVTGNVTLNLNGKTLGGAGGTNMQVSDGGTLTVDGDGDLQMFINVNENSKSVINGGELTYVRVYEEGNAEIKGGVINYLEIYGNAKISGGKFNIIKTANGSLESVLADGYAYKKNGGSWLSIAERAKEKYYSWNNEDKPVSVEEAPIKSATLSTEINKLYRNSNANPMLKFNLALAHGSNLNDSYVSKRYGINSYVSGDIIYSSLSALVKDAKLSADEIIDKAGNSVAAKIYFVVITDDGYEIKSNTVSIDLVDCDHSQVVDPTADKETAGNITEPTYCEICESKFNAKITKGDDVKYYNDLDEAAKDAQKSENEGCTLYPLYNKNGYGGQLVITEGNFTLKYAVRTAFSRPIIINGKAKLTVTGRCAVTAFENQDAFIVRGGDVTFDGLATGSNVTINGGNVTMTANNINCLTINGGNVSISSGGFAEIITNAPNKVIADYIDPGFWVQDRGTKEWIDIYSLNKATASSTNGLTVRLCPMQIIKPIDTVYYTNGYYPGDIPSLQISAVPWYSGEVDAKVAYQWIGIDENGNETEIEGATDRKLSLENLTTGRYYCRLTYSNATTAGVSMKSDVVTATITECEHSGGEATCTKKAKCEICGAEYGETKPHSYAQIKLPEYLKSAATCTAKAVYYTSCTECGRSSEGTADEATFEYGNALGHKYGEWVSNGDGTHTRVCANDSTHTETKACHGGKATCTAKAICEVCGKAYGKMTAHTFTAKSTVSRYLKKAATCTEKSEYYVSCAGCGLSSKGTKSEATFEGSALGHLLTQWNVTDASCTESGSEERHCTRCDYKQTQIIPAKGHTFGEWKITKNVGCVTDGEQTRECTVCGSKETKVIAATGVHVYGGWKVTKAPTCTTAGVKERTCTGCNAKETMTLQATGHKYTTSTVKPTYSAKGYTLYKCSLCGKSYKSNYTNMLVLPSVSGLKATSRTDKSITLGWNRNANATGYVIEYYNGAKWVKKSTVTKNTTVKYTVSSLKPGTVNKFRIRAYKATNYSAYSYITVNTLPSAVSGFKTVSKTSSTSTLRWNKNTSADGYIIERYIVNRWIQTQKVVGSGNVSTTIKSLTAGSTNKLRIRAYKTINKKTEYSSYTYLNVRTKPAQMTGLKAKSKTNNTVTLQWNKNATADSVFIEKYDGSKWVNVKKLSAGFTTYTVCKLSSGRTYRFRVRAYRAGEYSGYTYLNVNTRPYTTTGMKSKSVTKNSIVLQWNKNTSADGYSIEKYDGKKWVQVKRYTSNKSTTYTIKGLKARTTYKFRMRAYKTIGKVNEYSAYTYCNVTTAK